MESRTWGKRLLPGMYYRGGGETEEGEGGTGGLRYQGHLTWNIEILEKKISKYTLHLVETCVKLGSTEERTDKQYAIQMVSFLYDGLTSGGRRDLPAGVGRGEGERMMQIGSIFHPGKYAKRAWKRRGEKRFLFFCLRVLNHLRVGKGEEVQPKIKQLQGSSVKVERRTDIEK